jgi:hypothetical protein
MVTNSPLQLPRKRYLDPAREDDFFIPSFSAQEGQGLVDIGTTNSPRRFTTFKIGTINANGVYSFNGKINISQIADYMLTKDFSIASRERNSAGIC